MAQQAQTLSSFFKPKSAAPAAQHISRESLAGPSSMCHS